MRETGELVFTTTNGGTRTVRVPSPMNGITQFTLDLAVTRIINANPFDEAIGELEALIRADRIVVNRTVII